jgi:hypothetical protein
VFWVISVYFNIRNTLPKFFTFRPGHPVCVCVCVCVYIYIYIYIYKIHTYMCVCVYHRAFWHIQNVCTCMHPHRKPLQPLCSWSGHGTGHCLRMCVPVCLDGGVEHPACSVVLHVLLEVSACLVVRTHSEAQQPELCCETTKRTPLLTQFGKCPVI